LSFDYTSLNRFITLPIAVVQ